MNKRKNMLENKKFHKLTVIKYLGNGDYLCQCECGNQHVAKSYNLTAGNVRSCGCLRFKKTPWKYNPNSKKPKKIHDPNNKCKLCKRDKGLNRWYCDQCLKKLPDVSTYQTHINYF